MLEKSYLKYKKEKKEEEQISKEKAKKIAEKDIEGAFDWNALFLITFSFLTKPYRTAGEAGNNLCNDLFATTQSKIPFSSLLPGQLKWIEVEGAKQIRRVTDTTREIVKQQMINGLLERLNTADIAKNIAEKTLELAEGRSRNISRTETHNSIMAVTNQNLIAQGFNSHTWLTFGDEVVRDWHVDLDGETVQIGEQFSNGLLYPGDTNGPADEIVNCRCFVIPES